MEPVVGVGVGVECGDACDVVVFIAEGVWCGRLWVANGPRYFSPSSPGAKVTDEQNPSEDVISNVDPSFDLYHVSEVAATIFFLWTYQVISVKVAKCKLLTMHNGFCCCVS